MAKPSPKGSAPKEKPFKVRATERGFFGRLREPGDTFWLSSSEQFSDKWMEREEGMPKAVAAPATLPGKTTGPVVGDAPPGAEVVSLPGDEDPEKDDVV